MSIMQLDESGPVYLDPRDIVAMLHHKGQTVMWTVYLKHGAQVVVSDNDGGRILEKFIELNAD